MTDYGYDGLHWHCIMFCSPQGCVDDSKMESRAGSVVWSNMADAYGGVSIGNTLIAADQTADYITVLAGMFAASSSQAGLAPCHVPDSARPQHGT